MNPGARNEGKLKKVFAIYWHPQSMPRVLPVAPLNGDHEYGLCVDRGSRVQESHSFYGADSALNAAHFQAGWQ